MMWSSLAENQDLLTDVLLKLPVKSLLRFVLVSKEWYALIKSSQFISIHQSYLHRLNPNLRLLRAFNPRTNAVQFWLLGKEDTPLRLDLPVPVQHDCLGSQKLTHLVGSSNGLVCLWSHARLNEIIAIWNPTTGYHTYLPLSSDENAKRYYYRVLLGFGFINNTYYKVARILQGRGHRHCLSYLVQVFTQTDKSWREVKDCIPSDKYLFRIMSSKSINGVVYWVGGTTCSSNSPHYYIFSFNLHDEVFREISLPPPSLMNMISWKNSVAITTVSSDVALVGGREFEIWVMTLTKQGRQMPASWSRIELAKGAAGYPIGFWNDQILLMRIKGTATGDEEDLLYAYDPASKKQRKLYTLEKHFFFNDDVDHVESLFQVS